MAFWKDLGQGIVNGITGNPLGVLSSGLNFIGGLFGAKKRSDSAEKAAQIGADAQRYAAEQQTAASKYAADMQITSAREANDLNRQIHQEDLEQEWRMAHYQNAYNSAKAQMKRFRDAGVNPYLALGEGAMSSATMSVPSAAPQQGVGSLPVPDLSSLGRAGQLQAEGILNSGSAWSDFFSRMSEVGERFITQSQIVSDARKNNADAVGQEIENDFGVDKQIEILRNMREDSAEKAADKQLKWSERDYYDKLTKVYDKRLDWYNKTFDDSVKQVALQNQVLDEEAKQKDRQTKHIDFEEDMELLNWYLASQIGEAQARMYIANAHAAYSQAELFDNMALTEVEKKNLLVQQVKSATEQVKVDQKTAERIDDIIDATIKGRDVDWTGAVGQIFTTIAFLALASRGKFSKPPKIGFIK